MEKQETVTITRESYDARDRFFEHIELMVGFFFLRMGKKLFLGLYYKN